MTVKELHEKLGELGVGDLEVKIHIVWDDDALGDRSRPSHFKVTDVFVFGLGSNREVQILADVIPSRSVGQ